MGVINYLKYLLINPAVVDEDDQPSEIPCDEPSCGR
jgi:hypothetical protein